MNIFLREMKAHRKSLIFWCIGMVFMVAAGMGKFSGFQASAQSLDAILSQLPRALRDILGANYFDLSKATGFYGVLFLYLAIMSSIHASMLGADIIAKEERDKTAEFLFVKPVSRRKIITSKLLAALVNITILNIVTFIVSIVLVGYYSKGKSVIGYVAMLMLGMYILQLIFLFIGTGMAAVSKKPQIASALSTGILLITFVLAEAINIDSKLEDLKYLTPFKYFEAKDLMGRGSVKPVFVVLSVIIVAAMLGLTYGIYDRRDLNI